MIMTVIEMVDLSKLTPEERETLMRLVEKASADERNDGLPAEGEAVANIINQEREFGEPPKPNPITPSIRRTVAPEDAVEKMVASLEAVGRENYLKGISAPRKDPIKAAIAAEDKWAAKVQEAIKEKRRAKALETISMEEWAAMAEAGADRLVDGVKMRRHKIERFWKNWSPLLERHLAEIDKLPDKTDADREKRMLENLRGLKKLKGAWRK